MKEKRFNQSDYMSLQLMEIEKFRLTLSQRSHEQVTFQDAVMLWITEGLAEEFRSEYLVKKDDVEPALA
ncbi:MAG: hypothetical protein ACE5IW_01610 [bacterium]